MTTTWDGAPYPQIEPPGFGRTLLMVLRIALIVLITALGLLVFALERGLERIGLPRRVRYATTRGWGRLLLRIMGITWEITGTPMATGGAIVANHVSWLDIIVLRLGPFVTFVAKEEVRGWPGIGIVARVCDTMFVARRAAAAKRQEEEMRARIARGELLLFFPEGTSTDGRRVIPFKSTLFAAFVKENVPVQPVTLAYRAPEGQPEAFFGWWGTMGLVDSIRNATSLAAGGHVTLIFHPPLHPEAIPDRKVLARTAEEAVRQGLVQEGIRPEIAASAPSG
ncbi:MAG: lysophospholipid acyltransferase family protein [Rubricella sp.]